MKKIALIAVCSMGFASLVSAATLAEWSTVGMKGGFESNAVWNAVVLAPGMDAAKSCLKLDETKFAAAYFAAPAFTYRHTNDEQKNPDRYIQLILVPEAGRAMNMERLRLNIYSTVAGPQKVAIHAGLDNFRASLKTQDLVRGSNNMVELDLAALGMKNLAKPVEFRIHLWGAQGVQTGFLSDGRGVKAVVIDGSVSAK